MNLKSFFVGLSALAASVSLADTVADTPEAVVHTPYIDITPRQQLANVSLDDYLGVFGDKKETDKKNEASNVVGEALGQLTWFNGKPNKEAEFYIYLQSASWCGPCRAEMPQIAKEYKTMKKDGRVELVLLSGDKEQKSAQAFLKKNKAKFPGVMRGAEGVSSLPGADKLPGFFPAAVILKADGTVIHSGHGSIIRDWKTYTIESGM